MLIDQTRRLFLKLSGAAAVVSLAAPASADDQWPTRPVTVYCPFAAGTSTDSLMRLIAASLSD